jgi:hypothetical protein
VKRYIRVVTSTPYDEITEYQELDPEDIAAGEEHLEQIAADMFHNNCNYGYSVVDESEVPEGGR